jgi:transposase
MTVPGIGAMTALAFKTAVDEPERFSSSAAVGAYFGLTPSKYASGDPGQPMELAQAVGLEVLKRRGKMRAQVAVARRLAVIMHRMWLDGTDFRCQREADASAGAAA